MAEQEKQAPQDREAAVAEWEKTSHQSLVSESRKKKLNGLAVVSIAAVALGGIWLLKHGGGEAEKPAKADEVTIAERKAVGKLKDQAPADVPPVTNDDKSKTTTQADDRLRAQREQMELQRQEQERKMREARLKSAIVASNSSGGATGNAVQSGASAASALPNEQGTGAQDSNSRFARAVSGMGVPVSHANQIANLQYKVLQGKLIEAVLEPRAISDLPGMICATVQNDVYGATDRIVLIPWGSRICGQYSADLRKGQERLFAVWNTLRRPDGVEIALDSIGADQLGSSGMGGHVDNHFGQIFGVSALLSIIGAGSSNVGVNGQDQYNSAAFYRQAMQQSLANTSQKVMEPYANIPPTVVVPAGSRVRIYAQRDLDFSSIYEAQQQRVAHRDGVTFIQ